MLVATTLFIYRDAKTINVTLFEALLLQVVSQNLREDVKKFENGKK